MVNKIVIIVAGLCLIGGTAMGMGSAPVQGQIEPFVSGEQIIKEPERSCDYEGIKAACNQLLITLYKKDDEIDVPTKEDIIGLQEVILLVRQNGGVIVGQMPRLAILQIEILPDKNLLSVKKLLEQSQFIESVSFMMEAVFEGNRDIRDKRKKRVSD